MEMASLPEETLDYLIGDVLTEDLGSILYNTYNGDINLIKQAVMNEKASDFARAEMLDVMGQLSPAGSREDVRLCYVRLCYT